MWENNFANPVLKFGTWNLGLGAFYLEYFLRFLLLNLIEEITF